MFILLNILDNIKDIEQCAVNNDLREEIVNK